MSIDLVIPSSHLILCRPLLLLISIFPSIRVFSKESVLCIRWPDYWSFSFNISHFNKHPRLISFRMDWLDLLAVQGTLKSPLQHHSSTDQFFGTQLSSWFNSHTHTWFLEKNIAWTRWTFVGKVMPLRNTPKSQWPFLMKVYFLLTKSKPCQLAWQLCSS